VDNVIEQVMSKGREGNVVRQKWERSKAEHKEWLDKKR